MPVVPVSTETNTPPSLMRLRNTRILSLTPCLVSRPKAAGKRAGAGADRDGFGDGGGGDRSGRGERADAGNGERGDAEQRAGAAAKKRALHGAFGLFPNLSRVASPYLPLSSLRWAMTESALSLTPIWRRSRTALSASEWLSNTADTIFWVMGNSYTLGEARMGR